MSLLVAILCILFFGAVLLLVILNHGTIDVNLFFRTYERVPVAVVMVISVLVGIGFTSLVSTIDGLRIRMQNRRLRREVARLEEEIIRSRRMPLGDSVGGELPESPPGELPPF